MLSTSKQPACGKLKKEHKTMNDPEERLIDTIRSHDDHTEALLIATQVIIEFLTGKRSEEAEPPSTPKAS
jgi:hypothetical protein